MSIVTWDVINIPKEEGKKMKTYFEKVWKIMPVFLTAVLIATVGYAKMPQGMKGDVSGEMKMKAGAETMISAEHMILASLENHGWIYGGDVVKGSAMLAEGEKMIRDGKEMMMQSETRIKGKEMMMQGGSKMMEGKDFIMNTLKKQGMLQSTTLKQDEQELIYGENMMLKGKNLMMDGERMFE